MGREVGGGEGDGQEREDDDHAPVEPDVDSPDAQQPPARPHSYLPLCMSVDASSIALEGRDVLMLRSAASIVPRAGSIRCDHLRGRLDRR